MKRMLSIICAGAVLLGLTACKSDEIAEGEAAGAGGASVESTSADSSEQSAADVTVVTSAAHTAADISSEVADATGEAVQLPEQNANEPAEEYVPLTEDDIMLSIRESEPITTETTGFTIDVAYVGAADNAEYCYGSMYTLKRLTDNDEWIIVPFAEDAAFNLLGYLIGSDCPNNSLNIALFDEFYAEPLTAGTYCVEMEIDSIMKQLIFTVAEPEYTSDSASDEQLSGAGNSASDDMYIPLSDGDIIAKLDSAEYSVGTDRVTLALSYEGGNSNALYIVGCDYLLEAWSNEIGDWRTISFADDAAFDEIGHEVGAHSDGFIELDISDSMFTEKLTAGTYRITKPLCDGVDTYLVFDLKDVDEASGLTIERASGKISLEISEIRDDSLICILTFPSPLTYEVIGDPSLFSGFGVGDCICVEYAPMYKLDNMNYRLDAVSVSEDESREAYTNIADDFTFLPDY